MKKITAITLAVLVLAALALPAFATPTVDLENGLVLHYTFDEYDPATQTFADSSKVNPAPVEKMYGTTYTSPGPVGNAVYFDGGTYFMAYDDTLKGKLLDMNSLTFSVWLYSEKFPVESADKNRYFFTTQSWQVGDMHLQFVWGDYPGSCQVCINGNGKAPTGGMFEEKSFSYYRTPQLETKKWTLFTLVYDVNTNTIKYYADGNHVETATYTESVPVQIAALCVGNHYEIGKYPGFEGYLDDLRIYNRMLSDLEIMALAQMGNDTVEPVATEQKDVETTVAETKPAETKPEETKPAETKPAETKPAETKPAESKPAETVAPTTTAPAADTKKGCGSSVAVMGCIAALIPAAFCLKRKKH